MLKTRKKRNIVQFRIIILNVYCWSSIIPFQTNKIYYYTDIVFTNTSLYIKRIIRSK